MSSEVRVESDIIRLPLVGGPGAGARGRVLASFTNAQAKSVEDLQEIAELGTHLAKAWPVMQGAVGLWLWAKPAEMRSGSVSIWKGDADLRRFIRWPVHLEIMAKWRSRAIVTAETWEVSEFDPGAVWMRAEELIRRSREPAIEDRTT